MFCNCIASHSMSCHCPVCVRLSHSIKDYLLTYLLTQYSATSTVRWRFGAVGSDVGRINEVTLRRAQLVLGWVTVSGFNSRCGKFISV